MASLQKPDGTFKGRPGVSSKIKSRHNTAPEPDLKPPFAENKPHLYGTRGKEAGFKKQNKIEQKRGLQDSLKPYPDFACGLEPSSAAAGEPEPMHGETQTAIKNVHDMLNLAGFSPDPCLMVNSESHIVPHNQLVEEMMPL